MDTLAFIEAMRKATSNENGFIPLVRLAEYVNNNQVVIAQSRGKPIGCILHGVVRRSGLMHVTMTAVDFDWRNKGHATDAMRKVIARAEQAGAYELVARVASTIPAVQFFEACGFLLTNTEYPDNARRRAINIYTYQIAQRLISDHNASP